MVVRNLPLTSMMLETDYPYLLLPSFKGDTTRTNPEMVGELAKQIAGKIFPPILSVSKLQLQPAISMIKLPLNFNKGLSAHGSLAS